MLQSSATWGLLALSLSLLATPSESIALDKKTVPAEAEVVLLSPQALFESEFSNPNEYPAEVSTVDVVDQPFEKALQVTTGERTVDWWAIQVVMKTVAPVEKGDAIEASFYVRCLDTKEETGEARFRVLFQAGPPEYQKSLVAQFGASKQWRKITCPFTAIETTDAGASQFNFTFPHGPQRLEIGAVSLTNYGTAVSFADKTLSTITYPGQEPDAPWRASAQERIDRLRKADLVVSVRGHDGEPVSDARVTVTMTRHAFPFGTAVSVKASDGRQFAGAYGTNYFYTERDLKEYFYWLERWFTKAVPETALMPNGWTGVWPNLSRQVGIGAARDYRAMGYEVRGHMLVWPGWQWFAIPGVEAVKNDPEKLTKLVIDHVRDETAALREWIDEWTLLNEAYAHHDIMDVVGDDAMVDWFNVAHEADPKARLYINDYGILSGAGLDVEHQDHYAKTIQFLLDKGAPVHGIGFQGHFGDDPTAPDKVYEILERFAAFGKEMQITEFDINTVDNEMQADYTRDFITICFSHPAIIGFSFWGFWERDHWRPNGAMIRTDWTLKPSGEAYDKLVRHDWWTDEEGVTNTKGVSSFRGFLGDYRVTVFDGGGSQEHRITLKPGANNLEVVLRPHSGDGSGALDTATVK